MTKTETKNITESLRLFDEHLRAFGHALCNVIEKYYETDKHKEGDRDDKVL